MIQRIFVPFHGDGAGAGELTWGQRDIWREMRFTGVPLNMGDVVPLPTGTTVDELISILRYLVERHPSLRTRFLIDEDGRPCRQVLSGSGELPVEIADVDDDPAAVAEQIRRRYKERPFNYPNEWPVRMAIVRHAGVPTQVILMYCHLVVDAFALTHVLVPDLAERAAPRPNNGMPPLEQASRQATPMAQRHSDNALRHWTKALRTIPAARFRPTESVHDKRSWDVAYRSPATHLAVPAIAAHAGVEPTAVLLAVFAVTLADVTGRNPVVLQMLVSNRFRPGFAQTASPVAQTGLCVLDVAGLPFTAVISRARQASVVASMNAYYDPEQRDRLIAAAERERGEEIDLSCFFNHRAQPVPRAMPATDADELRDALGRGELTWDAPPVKRNERLFLSVDDRPDRMDYSVGIDARYFSRAATETLLRGMETLLVTTAIELTTEPAGRVETAARSGERA